MKKYRIIPLIKCKAVETEWGRQRIQQEATTPMDCKPAGIGWGDLPKVKRDNQNQPIALVWSRDLGPVKERA